MPENQPKHRRHEWSAIRELHVPRRHGRHNAHDIVTRLGAATFSLEELLHISRRDQVPAEFRR
jgi:hypothetical protein